MLRHHVVGALISLIYFHPPFISNADHSVMFSKNSGQKARTQTTAFEDKWPWDHEATAECQEMIAMDMTARQVRPRHVGVRTT